MGILDRFFTKKKETSESPKPHEQRPRAFPTPLKPKQNWIKNNTSVLPNYQLVNLRRNSREIALKDPIAAALFKVMLSSVIGTGLKVQSSVSAADLGVSESKIVKIRSSIEDAFKNWAENDADRAGISSFAEMQRVVFRAMLVDGEALAVPGWHEASHREFGRCVQLLTADDLFISNEFEGVEIDDFGTPTAYLFNTYDNHGGIKVATQVPKRIPLRDARGRLSVIHMFDADVAGQLRGTPLLTPAMKMFTDLADYTESELASARVSAAMAVFVTKTDSYAAMEAQMTDEQGIQHQELRPGDINYLSPGESISTVEPKRADGFGTFTETVIRMIGASVGLPYELLMRDFSKSNYSSSRAALLEARRVFDYYRTIVVKKFCQPLFEMVLEEACYREMITITPRQFELFKRKLFKTTWSGDAYGQIDTKKEAEAQIMRINAGLSTQALELSKLGLDFSDVTSQRKREKDVLDKLGLTPDPIMDKEPETIDKDKGKDGK